ncbi:hypothetical protein [Novosphingobium aquimarinum]|uniref:hypothetical protein n=1 Tax=Novosphingobium aquimarinum TaxID=2682494 RepID=UPI0012EC3C3A|nr:hypothetical protein [Novosphingobium aquimarinum]
MERADWIDRLSALSFACIGTTIEQQANRLREFNDLLIRAPEVHLVDGLRPVQPDVLESLIRVDALESAILSMLDDAAYMISRGCGGHMVTVLLPGSEDERTVTGDTLSLALLTATAQALIDSARDSGAPTTFSEFEHRSRQLH